MAVLVGIDEAGYGPILGPLVASCAAFSIPDEFLGSDLWDVLRRSVGKSRRKLAGRLLITDSKKAYNRMKGIGQLERTVLACMRCAGKSPVTAGELMEILCPACAGRLVNYPWYEEFGPGRLVSGDSDIAIAAGALKKDLERKNAQILSVSSRCLDVAYYNHRVDAVKNKASVLFSAICELIKKTLDSSGQDNLQILIDRQSGRRRYAGQLLRMFPGMELRILREDDTDSSYELRSGGKKMRLRFAVDADDRFLPVSLASMVSKYVREIMVASINRYFADLCADLTPTAGYWKDGLRFIKELDSHSPGIEYEPSQLIRSR